MLAPQEECFSNIIQDFLICTTIHKARQLEVFQGDIYVRIILDKMTRTTRSFSNSENPYFNEYFVYEIKCTLMELLRLTILYEVKKHTTCKKNPTLGELLIDMQSVWNQPNRCYFKKWGRLESPIGQNASADGVGKGFLQIDLAIISQASNPNTLLRPYEDDLMGLNKWQINQDYDDIENNLLHNIDTGVKCNIRYTVTFYRGIMSKKSDYLIQVSLAGYNGKTNVAKNTQQPSWNQEISFVWTYPSLAQTFLIQLLAPEHLQWKCVSEYELHFNEIAFNDKPALGPTFIHLYDNLNGSQYVGRVLVEIKSECLKTDINHVLTIKQIPALDERRYWQEETFLLEFLVMQGDFMHGSSSNCKINVKLAEWNSNNLECFLKNYKSSKKGQTTSNNLKYFSHEPPYKAITLRVQLPDNRSKFESDIFLQELLDYMKYEIETFKMFQVQYMNHPHSQMKVLRALITSVMNKMLKVMENKRLEHTSSNEPTQWDINRLNYLNDYFLKIPQTLRCLRSRLKPCDESFLDLLMEEVLLDLIKYCHELQHLLSTTLVQDEWPDLILVLLMSNKEVGFCRLNAKNFLYPSKDRQTSTNSQCWTVRNFIFKDIDCRHSCVNCGCTVAIVRGCLSIVAESHNANYLENIAEHWKHPEPFYWSPTIHHTTYRCRIFIHQAKIRPGADRNGLCDPYIRVMVCLRSAETTVFYTTLSPIWNCVINFENIQLPGQFRWCSENPPLIAIELYDTDKKTADDYLGSGFVPVSVISNQWADSSARDDMMRNRNSIQKFQELKNLSPPPLKWIPLSVCGAIRAEILMSGELVELQNNDKIVSGADASVTVGIPNAIRPNMKNFVLEVVFAGFRNYNKSNICASKHRVKLMMADLLLTSGLSTSRLKNSMNFLILYASGVVSLPDKLEYWPAIIATDVAVSGKGNENTLGAVLIANSKRYLQKERKLPCVCKVIGDEQEMDTSIASSSFHIDDEDGNSEVMPLLKKKSQKTCWQRFVSKFKGSPKEILPSRETFNLNDVFNEHEFSWWTKFYNSGIVEPCSALTHCKHKLCVFQNELEKEVQFSNMTDWAEPLNMVHGVKYKKNSLPKEEVYATLKLNIKITPCQCDRIEAGAGDGGMLKPLATALNPRYQAQLQSLADLVKIVVRVYIVQGLQFRPGEKNAQADSYVKIQLGQKYLTNRAHYIPNESNPIFGKCFQLDGLLPREQILEISIFNRNCLKDDLIGNTYIDLEDRWRSKHRARVGIANEYSSIGYNKWRDNVLPSEILKELCSNNDLKPPKIIGNIIEVDGVAFEDETQLAVGEDLQERLSLTALKHLEHLPSFGYKLVPEHVETRSLYRNECPGIEQGKLQLWIELYDGNLNIPPSIDLTPEPPHNYELRVIVYNVVEVVLDETNIFGTAMTDIYLKGWCTNFDEAQNTDIHYRSTDGEGKFNWRMLFPLKYSAIEDMVVIKRKYGLREEYEMKQPPIFSLQVWDNDVISADDFLGTLEIHLSSFPQPFDTAKHCHLADAKRSINMYGPSPAKAKDTIKKPQPLINIFRKKKIRGWFPMKGSFEEKPGQPKQIGLAGKVDLELEIVTEAEAAAQPVGLGRNPPNALPAPVRPETSFNPFTNPWKGVKNIILPKLKRYFLIGLVMVVVGFSLFIFIMKLPLIISGLGF